MKVPIKEQISFYTSYHQFYICDKQKAIKEFPNQMWTDDGLNRRFEVKDGFIGVLTASYGNIELELELLDRPKENINISDYDHIVEGSINIDSGILQILDCPDTNVVFETNIDPGYYRVRVYSSNLDILDEDEGGDFYKIEIWKDKKTEILVLKNYGNGSN